MDSLRKQFEELWEDYISSFKGNLLTQLRNQPMSYNLAKLSLEEATLTWLSEFDRRGRWLLKLQKSHPDKAADVKDIIKNDISIKEITINESKVSSIKYLIPTALGVGGYLLAKHLAYDLIKTACLTVIPALISIPMLNSFVKTKNQKACSDAVDSYVAQLDKYKNAIIDVLMK